MIHGIKHLVKNKDLMIPSEGYITENYKYSYSTTSLFTKYG